MTDVWSFKILNDKNLSVENRLIDTESKAVVSSGVKEAGRGKRGVGS